MPIVRVKNNFKINFSLNTRDGQNPSIRTISFDTPITDTAEATTAYNTFKDYYNQNFSGYETVEGGAVRDTGKGALIQPTGWRDADVNAEQYLGKVESGALVTTTEYYFD